MESCKKCAVRIADLQALHVGMHVAESQTTRKFPCIVEPPPRCVGIHSALGHIARAAVLRTQDIQWPEGRAYQAYLIYTNAQAERMYVLTGVCTYLHCIWDYGKS